MVGGNCCCDPIRKFWETHSPGEKITYLIQMVYVLTLSFVDEVSCWSVPQLSNGGVALECNTSIRSSRLSSMRRAAVWEGHTSQNHAVMLR